MLSTVTRTRISLPCRKNRHMRGLFQYTVTDVEREEYTGSFGEERTHTPELSQSSGLGRPLTGRASVPHTKTFSFSAITRGSYFQT